MTTPNTANATANATNTTLSNMEAASTIPMSQRYFGAASGLLFVVLWIASLLLPNRLAPVGVPFPNPITSTSEQILSYYAHAQTAGLIASMLQLLSTLPLLGFTAYVVVAVRRA